MAHLASGICISSCRVAMSSGRRSRRRCCSCTAAWDAVDIGAVGPIRLLATSSVMAWKVICSCFTHADVSASAVDQAHYSANQDLPEQHSMLPRSAHSVYFWRCRCVKAGGPPELREPQCCILSNGYHCNVCNEVGYVQLLKLCSCSICCRGLLPLVRVQLLLGSPDSCLSLP